MAENSSKLGLVLAVGVTAAIAGAAAAYLKREEIKKIAAEVAEKMKPTEEEGVFAADVDDDGTYDIIMADTTEDGQVDSVIVDVDGDGEPDAVIVDTTGDGELDTIIELAKEEEAPAEEAAE